MNKYRIVNSVREEPVEKSRLPVKKRIIRRNACGSSVFCHRDASSAVILSEPQLRPGIEPVKNIFSKEVTSEYEENIDSQLDPDKYFQCDQYPLAKSREEIQFWVATAQPPCLYYSDNYVSKYKTRRRFVKKPSNKRYLRHGITMGMQDIFSDTYGTTNNNTERNSSTSPELSDDKYQVATSVRLKRSKEEPYHISTKPERNKSLFKKAKPDICVGDKDTSLKIQLSKKQLNDLSMNVERGSFSLHGGKVLPSQKRTNQVLINVPEDGESHRKILHKKDELLEDFDSCSSVLTVNYIRSVNSAAKMNGKRKSPRNKQYFSYNNKSPQKRNLGTGMHENCKILRRNQYENYVPNEQFALNRIKCEKASPLFKSIKKEIAKPTINNESEYLNGAYAKNSRMSLFIPSPDELKRNNEKVLESCQQSTSSIENDTSENYRNQSTKTTVSQMMAVQTYTTHHNTMMYSEDNISSENSDIPLNVVNKSIKHTTRTISFTKVENIQYFVNH